MSLQENEVLRSLQPSTAGHHGALPGSLSAVSRLVDTASDKPGQPDRKASWRSD